MIEDILLLFDVDGTLTRGANVHFDSFTHALKKVYGVDSNMGVIKHQGSTDRKIVIDVLKANNYKGDILGKLDNMVDEMVSYYKNHRNEQNLELIPGVKQTLEYLKKENFHMGLLTGNLEPIAWEKMEKIGLKDYFNFGAFGTDEFERYKFVDVALKKAKKLYNKQFKKKDTYLIGDTPRDIEAAKLAGVNSIAVATGDFTLEQLKEHKPNYLMSALAGLYYLHKGKHLHNDLRPENILVTVKDIKLIDPR
jgi:phosphoglycolate phosphatase-like HAD superfamily hydrolase